jgi:prepilin-type processing-associated H-X9-DG protein/prepilin-type N-terminal cleavage/methylation domain-containing protein
LNNVRGFTLVELLAVVAIIAVVAALLLPAISRPQAKAHQAGCLNNLRQLGLGLQDFAADNHAYPSGISGTNSDSPGTWMLQLQRGGFDVSKPATNFFSQGVWRCPSATFPQDAYNGRASPLSYGYNVYGSRHAGSTDTLGLMGHFVSLSAMFAPIKESEVSVPSDMMALGDSFSGGVFLVRGPPGKRASARHQNKVNVAFCDGHVESQTLESVFQSTNDVALARWNRDHLPHRDKL